MTFSGVPWSLLGAIAGGLSLAVTILYMVKLRRQRLVVPNLSLWEPGPAGQSTTPAPRRLRRLFSWLLALLFLALVSLAATDPATTSRGARRSWVLLLDSSASMRSLEDGEPRFAQARSRLKGIVERMGSADLAMIVAASDRPRPLTSWTNNPKTLIDALDAAQPLYAPADLGAAVAMASDLLTAKDAPHIFLATDGAGAPWPSLPSSPPLSVLAVGESTANIGIVAFNARPYPGNRRHYEVFLRVSNTTAETVQARVVLRAQEKLVEVLPLSLPPETITEHLFADLSSPGQRLQATLEHISGAANHLDADDTAFALLPSGAPMGVALYTRGNYYLEAALMLDESLRVSVLQPDQEAPPGTEAWVFDQMVPAEPPPGPALYIAPPAGAAPWALGTNTATEGPLQVLRAHPLGKWISLPDVHLAAAAMRLEKGEQVIASKGGKPLVIASQRGGSRSVIWTFNPFLTELPLRAAFPLLLMRTMEWFSAEGSNFQSSLPLGQTWRLPVPEGEPLRIQGPDGAPIAVAENAGVVRLRGRAPGFYRLAVGANDVRWVAASLSSREETDIAPQGAPVDSHPLPPNRRANPTPLWVLLAWTAWAWLLLEWISYQRRWTV